MLLTSKALDITARRCLSSPYPSKADLYALSQLLSTVLPPTVQQPAIDIFVSALHNLSKAMPSSSSADAFKAQEAVGTVIACLKEQQPAPESTSSAQSVSSDIPERAAALDNEIQVLQYKLAANDPASVRYAMSDTDHCTQVGKSAFSSPLACATILPYHGPVNPHSLPTFCPPHLQVYQGHTMAVGLSAPTAPTSLPFGAQFCVSLIQQTCPCVINPLPWTRLLRRLHVQGAPACNTAYCRAVCRALGLVSAADSYNST